MAPKKKADDAWQNCEAKRILYADLLAGLLPLTKEEMTAREVYDRYQDEPAFAKIPWKNFTDRLKRLRAKVIDKDTRSERDAKALAHDRLIYPKATHNHRGEPYWPDSKAKALLEKDIDDGKHLRMTKKELYLSKPEYQEFYLHVFRGHVYQEIKRRKFVAYCQTTKRGREYGAQKLLINQRRNGEYVPKGSDSVSY